MLSFAMKPWKREFSGLKGTRLHHFNTIISNLSDPVDEGVFISSMTLITLFTFILMELIISVFLFISAVVTNSVGLLTVNWTRAGI